MVHFGHAHIQTGFPFFVEFVFNDVDRVNLFYTEIRYLIICRIAAITKVNDSGRDGCGRSKYHTTAQDTTGQPQETIRYHRITARK